MRFVLERYVSKVRFILTRSEQITVILMWTYYCYTYILNCNKKIAIPFCYRCLNYGSKYAIPIKKKLTPRFWFWVDYDWIKR